MIQELTWPTGLVDYVRERSFTGPTTGYFSTVAANKSASLSLKKNKL